MLHVAVYRNRKHRMRSDGAIAGNIQSVRRRPIWLWMWLAGQRRKPWPQARYVNTTELGPLCIRVSWGKPVADPS